MNVDLAIVGVHKCATTSLLRGLGQHPEINAHFTGQTPPVFCEEQPEAVRVEALAACFNEKPGATVSVVRDTSLYLDSTAVQRLDAQYPGVRLLVAVRDPVQRAFSAFNYAVEKGFEDRESFSAIIRSQSEGHDDANRPLICQYIRMGRYAENLRALEAVVGRDRIHVVHVDALKDYPAETYRELFSFIGVSADWSVQPVVANVASRSRSRTLSRLLLSDNALKRLLRAMLPLRLRVAVRTWIAKFNARSTPPKRELATSDAQFLRSLFVEDAQMVARHYGVDVWTGQNVGDRQSAAAPRMESVA